MIFETIGCWLCLALPCVFTEISLRDLMDGKNNKLSISEQDRGKYLYM